jgi:hypothetical protein
MDSATLPLYAEKDNVAASNPPSSSATHDGTCQVHGPTQTPILDNQLSGPHSKANLQALSAALADATREGACLKCTTDAIVKTLTTFMQDVRTAKKSGQWSHDEKKALKAEVKGLAKGMKHDLKQSWRDHKGDSPKAVSRGIYWKR